MAKRLVLILSMIVAINVQSQVSEYPIHFGQFFNNPNINPANGGSESGVEIYLGHKQNTGKLEGINTSYVGSFFQLGKVKNSFHVIGFQFLNSQEGPVLRRNRGYLSYSRQQQLSERWVLSAGLSGGYYNFSIKSNPVLGGVASGTFDGSAGLRLYSRKSSLALSIQQMNGGTVRPVDQEINLQKLYTITADHNFTISEGLELTPSLIFSADGKESDSPAQHSGLALNLLIRNTVNIGASYEEAEGVYAFLGIRNIGISSKKEEPTRQGRFDLDLAYFMPNLNNDRTRINTVEVSLKYFIDKVGE